MMWRRRWRRRMWRRSFEAYIHMSARACDALGIPFILCTCTRGKLGVVRAAQGRESLDALGAHITVVATLSLSLSVTGTADAGRGRKSVYWDGRG
jgi:hypothetical protein